MYENISIHNILFIATQLCYIQTLNEYSNKLWDIIHTELHKLQFITYFNWNIINYNLIRGT